MDTELDKALKQIENLPNGCEQAMDAAFDLHDAVMDYKLTIGDLMNTVRLAVADGHEAMLISLTMMSIAIRNVYKEGKP